MNALLPEEWRVHVGGDITNIVAGAFTGDRVNMENFEQIAIIVQKSDGTASEDPVLTVQQHDAATSGNSKALDFLDYWVGSHASDLTTLTSLTRTSQGTADEQITLDGETEYLVVIPLRAEMLDTDNGYTFVSLNISDPGTTGTSYCAVLYLLGNPRYADASAIDVIA